jgi:hypothetical protein
MPEGDSPADCLPFTLENNHMIVRLVPLTILALLCVASTVRADSSDHFQKVESGSQRLMTILRPHVRPLDRDVWVFRYEVPREDSPKTLTELSQNYSDWAARFFNPDVVLGADTGPGIYVAVDPAATSTWGGPTPLLAAMKIKAGSMILTGDSFPLADRMIQDLNSLAKDFDCGSSSTNIEYDLGHSVGYFRMNQSKLCREIVVSALKSLQVQALTYGFNSIPLKDCRTTSTAFSIIDFNSIKDLNRFGGSPLVSTPQDVPFIKRLFAEAKSDFYVESLLKNLTAWKAYHQAFHLFDDVSMPDEAQFQEWKNRSILKCGTRWSVEEESPLGSQQAEMRRSAHPLAKQVLVEIAIRYRMGYQAQMNVAPQELNGLAAEFRIEKMKGFVERFSTERSNLMKIAFGNLPEGSKRTQRSYLRLIRHCLAQYQTRPFLEVAKGACGVKQD